MAQGEEIRQITAQNIGYQDFNIIQLRLDTQKLHEDVKNFLKGKRTVYVENKDENGNATGQYGTVEEIIGKPLLNDLGFQNVFSFVCATVNSHTVQGNKNEAGYYDLMFAIYDNLNQMFTINREAWGVEYNSAPFIVDSLVYMIELFLSRTINDKERENLKPLVSTTTTRDKLAARPAGGFV